MPLQELVKRVAVAAVGVPLTLVFIHFGGWPLALAMAAIAALAARELFGLGRAREIDAFQILGIAGATALVLFAGVTRSFEAFSPYALTTILAVFFSSAAGAIWLRWPDGRPLSSVPLTLAGVVYAGGGMSFALLLRYLPEVPSGFESTLPFQGQFLLIFPMAVTWTGDTAAYFFGHLLGNRKLIPAVSPGKTVVGGVAGLVTSFVVGAGLGWLALGLHPDSLVSALLGGAIGAILGVGAQVGDLVESILKREAGVKDSGTIFPGHGGVLDRFDALLFTLPLTYALVRLAGLLQ